MNRKISFSEVERYIKKSIKGKLKFSRALVISFLISGCLSSVVYGSNIWIDNSIVEKKSDLSRDTTIWNDGIQGDNRNFNTYETILLADKSNRAGEKTNVKNINAKQAVIIGSRAVGGGKSVTSIGYKAIVGINEANVNAEIEHQGTAVGYRTFARGKGATSLGNDTVAWGESSIAIGSDEGVVEKYSKPLSRAAWDLFDKHQKDFNNTKEYSVIDRSNTNGVSKKQLYYDYRNNAEGAKKSHTWARGKSSIAIGTRTIAYGDGSTAMGTLAIAGGNYSTAFGAGSIAFGDSSISIGNEAYVYASESVGIGNNVQAISEGSIVYGLKSYAGGTGSVAIGTNVMTNVKMSDGFEKIANEAYEGNIQTLGKLDHNLNSLEPVTEEQPGFEEKKAEAQNTGAVGIGYYAVAYGENSIALGRHTYSKGNKSVAIGPYAYSKGTESFALGYGSKSIGNQSFSIGSYSIAEGKNSIALGIGSKVLNNSSDNNLNGENSLALGNESEVKMRNSVALGYKSTTKYYYKDNKYKNEHSIDERDKDNNAMNLKGYIPEGSSYDVEVNQNDGIISVGAWDKGENKVGLRRIVGVAAGALDSDVATVGQLKALQYTKKEGVVTYYTQEGDKIYKVIKAIDGKFYKVNTDNGTPLDNIEIDKEKVFAGPKGFNEQVINVGNKKTSNMGEKIKFAHILDGEISPTSDQAVTGAQLHSVKDVLGAEIADNNAEGFKKSKFKQLIGGTINSSSPAKQITFKDAIDKNIDKINQGIKFKDGENATGTHYLGDTLTIKGGSIEIGYSESNIKTKYNNKELLIGIKDEPTFNKVTLSTPQTYSETDKKTVGENDLISRKYLDGALANVASSFSVKGDKPSSGAEDSLLINGENNTLNINGGDNITTTVTKNDKKITVALKGTLTGIESITKGTNKAKLTLKDNEAILESANNKSKIELKDGEIDLTTSTGKTVKVKDNELDGVNKISATTSDTITTANSIDLAKDSNGNNKDVVITAAGKTLTIAKDEEKGISLTGLADRKVDESGYGTNGSAGRAATESAVLDLKTKGLTFEANKNTDKSPKGLKRELGETLKITGKDGDVANFDNNYSLENIATKIDESNKAIRIGLLKTPRFDALELGKADDKKITLTPNANGDTLELKLTGAGTNNNNVNVKISGVANGIGDNDAINKLQLNGVVTALGGGASIDTDNGTIKSPTYSLKVGAEQGKKKDYTTVEEALTALDGALNSELGTLKNSKLTFAGNDYDNNDKKVERKLGEILKIVGEKSITDTTGTTQITTAANNITVKKKDNTQDTLEIGLSDALKGIKSVANDDNTKIELKNENGTKSIVFTAGDSNKAVTLTGDEFSGVSKIANKDNTSSLKLAADNTTVELAHDKSKLELKDKEATITTGDDAGSIKIISKDDDKKIELSPEKGATLTLTKDTTNNDKVKATGLSTVGLDDTNALTFTKGTNGTATTASLKVDNTELKFTKETDKVKISNVADGQIANNSTEAINGKQLDDLAGKLGVAVNSEKTGFTQPQFKKVNYHGQTKDSQTTFKDAIDDLITAVNKGMTFKGNEGTAEATLQLGGTLTIDSSVSKKDKLNATEKDITAKTETDTNGVKLTLTLNKSTLVKEDDERLVTSKAVADELKKYTPTATLQTDFLKVTGENIGNNHKTFGKNVGISKINLEGDKSTTELVQANAVINYLKGDGKNSVKVSDNPNTKADGEGSVAIGDGATVAKEAGDSIALGQGSKATEKEQAFKTSEFTVSTKALKFDWGNAGTSTDENDKRAVVSIGDTGSERLIKNVAAGSVKLGSTDAVNGGQLYSVIDTFGKLGIDVIGAEVEADADKFGFKKPSFTKLMPVNGEDKDVKAPETFKAAIDENIKKLNEGLMFSADENAEDTKPVDGKDRKHYLGSKISINKLADTTVTADATAPKPNISGYKGDNLITKYTYNNGNANIEIGFKDAPTFKAITLSEAQAYNKDGNNNRNNDVITKKYLEEALDSFKIKVKANDGKEVAIGRGDTIEFKNGLNIEIGMNGDKPAPTDVKPDNATPKPTQPTPKPEAPVQPEPAQPTPADPAKPAQPKAKITISTTKQLKDLESIEFAQGKDGKGGIGVIKGLADLDDNSTGDMVVNKNYIDNKIAAQNANRPFDYYLGEEKVVKGQDGKFYKASELEGAKFDANKKVYIKNDKPITTTITDEQQQKVVIKAESSNTPMKLTNIKSGLGLDDGLKGKEKEEKEKEVISELVKDTSDKIELNNATTVKDLQAVAKAGVNFKGNDGKDIHKNIGEAIEIVGKGYDKDKFKATSNNIAVLNEENKLQVTLNKDLTGMSSFETEADKDGNSSKLTADSLTFNDKSGNSKVKIDGGKSEINFSKKDGKITGLANLDDKADGSSATNKNYVDSKLGNMEFKLREEVGSASALNAALSSLKPLAYDPLRASQFTAGMGIYKGKTAFALGLNHYTSENTLINGGVSFAAGTNVNDRRDIMFNLGFTHKFGSKADIDKLPKQYQAGPISSIYAMQDEMQAVKNENAELKARLEKQEAQIQMLLKKIK